MNPNRVVINKQHGSCGCCSVLPASSLFQPGCPIICPNQFQKPCATTARNDGICVCQPNTPKNSCNKRGVDKVLGLSEKMPCGTSRCWQPASGCTDTNIGLDVGCCRSSRRCRDRVVAAFSVSNFGRRRHLINATASGLVLLLFVGCVPSWFKGVTASPDNGQSPRHERLTTQGGFSP